MATEVNRHSDDYVTKEEFRFLLVNIKTYFVVLQQFEYIAGDDKRISKKEWKEKSVSLCETLNVRPPMFKDIASEDYSN
jgi:hypothetical protein